MPTLLIASRNAHKAEEIGAILGDEFTVLTLATFPDAPPVIEDGDSFAANATKKSREIATWLENQALGQALPDYILADDSGLEVDALVARPAFIPPDTPPAKNKATPLTPTTMPSCCARWLTFPKRTGVRSFVVSSH